MWGNITKKSSNYMPIIKGPNSCKATFIKYNCRIKYIWKQRMEVVSLKLMYFCHVLHRLSKHFLTFDDAWLTKSNVMRWNITLASFAFVWFIPFKVLQKGESIRSSQPNQISWPTASPSITRGDNHQVLEMIIIPCHGHSNFWGSM